MVLEVKEKVTDKRSAIFDATLRMVIENGFVATPMSLIAVKAGVAAGTIYRYFENKEHLLNELYKELRERMSQVIISSFIEGLAPFDQFKLIYANVLKYYIEKPDEFQFLEKFSSSAYITEQTLDETSLTLAPIVTIFNSNDRTLVFKQMPVEMLFAHVYGPMISLMNLKIDGKIELNDNEIEKSAEATWDAITQ